MLLLSCGVPPTLNTSFASLVTSRAHHCTVALRDDDFLITGGVSAQGDVLPTAEILNSTRGESTIIPSLHIPRTHHSCIRLSSGEVALIGGIGADGKGVSVIDVFNPKTSSFSLSKSLLTPRAHHSVVLLANDVILVTGGLDEHGNVLNDAELIEANPISMTPLTSTMQFPRFHHQALALGDGRVLISGGGGSEESRVTAELYDPIEQRFSAPIQMGTERVIHTLTALNDGRVLAFSNGRGDVYSPDRFQFQPVPGNGGPGIREGHSATLLLGGQVLILGGGVPEDDEDLLGAPVLFNPADQSYRVLNGSDEMVNRADHTATRLSDGRVLVTGGRTLDVVATDDVIVFDPQQASFYFLPRL